MGNSQQRAIMIAFRYNEVLREQHFNAASYWENKDQKNFLLNIYIFYLQVAEYVLRGVQESLSS